MIYIHYTYRSNLNSGTYSTLVSGEGRSPIVVSVNVDQYTEPRYFLVKLEYPLLLYW